MSLWPVDDRSAREWMSEFYRAALGRRRGAAEAVREASRVVLARHRASGTGTHPFHWAAFVAADGP